MRIGVLLLALLAVTGAGANGLETDRPGLTDAQAADWLTRWSRAIVAEAAANRYADRELGEELGWLVSPFASGFYEGWRATGDRAWIDRLFEWTDAWTRRATVEPDGYPGWPKTGSGSPFEKDHLNDSLLGEAMAMRPVVLMAKAVLSSTDLEPAYGGKARAALALAERIFEKWDRRGAWREVGDAGIWVVPEFGLTPGATAWTDGYASRTTTGFSNPDNKNNLITAWVLALADATGRPVYRDRAERWFRLMKSRQHPGRSSGTLVWNYWDRGGPWDDLPGGRLKHWVGVHPNGGYYGIDAGGIALAYEHGLVFTADDLAAMIRTNRDAMWNGRIKGAAFGMINGGKPDPRWPDTPGVLWTGLLPYDATLRRVFEATHRPDGWGGLALTPWYLALRRG